jgi:HD superfamily phosphohydrolase
VYLHKTVLSAEYMLINILKRAKYLATQNIALNSTPALHYFLYHQIDKHDFEKNTKALDYFALLDDVDIFSAVKMWTQHPDLVLSELCKRLVNRNLYKIKISNTPFEKDVLQKYQQEVMQSLKINEAEVPYFVFTETAKNNAYDKKEDNINILYKNGDLKDIAEASDHMNINVLSGAVIKYFLCYLPA